MFFFLFGIRSSKLKVQKINTNCVTCNTITKHKITGKASYIHFFWIPVLPLGNHNIQVICTSCGDVKKITKEDKIETKTPSWHLIGLFLIAAGLIGAFLTIIIENHNLGKVRFSKQLIVELQQKENKIDSVYQIDKQKLNNYSNLTIDSISNTIKTEFDFSKYGLINNNLSFFSKKNKQQLLVFIDLKKEVSLSTKIFSLIREIEQFLIKKHHNNINNIFIAIFTNGKLLVVDNQNQKLDISRNVEDILKIFYRESLLDTFYYGNTLDEEYVKKMFYFYKYKNLNRPTIENDLKHIKQLWNKINVEYFFINKTTPTKFNQKNIFYFHQKTDHYLPESLKILFELYSSCGPFLNKREIITVKQKLQYKFKNTPYNILIENNSSKKKIIPVKFSPYWIPFYKDNIYTYLIDLLPNRKGYYEQIIMIDNKNKVSFVSKNIESFLEQFNNKEIPTDLNEWIK